MGIARVPHVEPTPAPPVNLTPEQEAYVQSVIGSKSARVPAAPPTPSFNRVYSKEFKEKFLDALLEQGSVQGACRVLNIHRSVIHSLLINDPTLDVSIKEVLDGCVDIATTTLLAIGLSPAGADGKGGGRVQALNSFLKRHGALTDVSNVKLETGNIGLADIAKAIEERDRNSK
jgi:hypothetical protein